MTAAAGEIVVRLAEPGDRPVIRSVLSSAFGRPVVADLADALAERADGVALVAVEGSRVVGCVGLSRSWVDAPDRVVDVVVLSPLGVVPDRQRQGVGRALMAGAVAAAVRTGSRCCSWRAIRRTTCSSASSGGRRWASRHRRCAFLIRGFRCFRYRPTNHHCRARSSTTRRSGFTTVSACADPLRPPQ